MEILLMGSIFLFSALTLLSYLLIVLNISYLIIPIVLLAIIFGYKLQRPRVRCFCRQVLTMLHPRLKSRGFAHECNKPLKNNLKKIKNIFNKKTILVLTVFALGILGQLAVISPSGIFQNGDLVFWSAHGHDGMWHIALMEEINKSWPLQNPIFAGERLVNYHFFSDILPAIVAKYTPLSTLNLYFRIFPFFYSLFLGVSAFYLTKKLTKSFSASIWATVFTYFAGSFGFILTYLKNKTIGGESIFWATQPQSSSGNPPQIISNFLFLASIYYIISFLQEKNKHKKRILFFINLVLIGTISSFKIYAGVVLLGTLSIISIWQFIKIRKTELFFLTLIGGLLALALYLPNTSNSTSFLIFEPWWFIRTMIVEPSRLNLLDWELRRQTYIYENNWKRVIWLEGLGFIIFFFGNLGMRFLGLWEFVKSKGIFKISIVLSLVLPLLFLQKGVASNTAQFLQYFVLLFGILAGIAISKIRFPTSYILYPISILLMIPTQYGLLKDFYGRPAFAKVSSTELEALKYIKQNTDEGSVILTPPYNQYLNLEDVTPNIWDWFDTSYVSALTSRHTYFDDYEQVDIMGYDFRSRLEIKRIIFESEDVEEVKKVFESTNADILYFPKSTPPKVSLKDLGLVNIFENSSVEVWRAN